VIIKYIVLTKPIFPVAFKHVVCGASQPIYDEIMKMEKLFLDQSRDVQNQYREALIELKQSHRQLMEHISKDDLTMMKQQQQKEVMAIHTQWHTKIRELFYQHQKEYADKILAIYKNMTDSNVTKEADPSLSMVESPTENAVQENTLDPTIQALVDMGFSAEDSKCALEISKGNMEGAIMLLLESPEKIKEHQKQSKNSVPLQNKRTPQQLFQRRKSNSFSLSPHSSQPTLIAKGDLAQYRSFSSPKIHQESKPSTSAKNSQRVLSTSPFGRVGNFLEKAMDAFRIDDDKQQNSDEDEVMSDTFTVYCGSQQHKTMYNLWLQVSDIESHFVSSDDPMQKMAIKASKQQTLYSNTLSGMIFVVRESDLPDYVTGVKINKRNHD
jgi:hypothetical protein